MVKCKEHRNYLTEMRELLRRIRATVPEPEICNVTCPPLGCPRGPCPGICRDECGRVDPCGMSQMPDCCEAHSAANNLRRFVPDPCCHQTHACRQ